MPTQKKLAIFDMDGTLIDSSTTIANAINYVRDNLYLPPLDPKTIISKINDHTINPARFFYMSDRFQPEHEKWFSEYYSKNHKNELQLYDGIPDMLEKLKEQGILLAVATNAYRRSALESLEHLQIADLMDSVACYDDVEKGKPYPDMLLKIMDDLGAGKGWRLIMPKLTILWLTGDSAITIMRSRRYRFWRTGYLVDLLFGAEGYGLKRPFKTLCHPIVE